METYIPFLWTLPPTHAPIPPIRVITEHELSFSALLQVPTSNLLYIRSAHTSNPISQFVPPPPTCVHTSIFYVCVSIAALQIGSSVLFSRFHIHVLTYDYFSLSDLLHFVWQTLGPSTPLQMTHFCPFLWLSNFPLYICMISFLFTCQWPFKSLPCPG